MAVDMDPISMLVRSCAAFYHLVRCTSLIDVATGLATIWALCTAIWATQKNSRTTKLRGPKRTNLLFGVSTELFGSPDSGAIFEAWSKEYGVAYEIPMMCGKQRIVLCDPKALAYLFSKDTWSYAGIPGVKASIARRVGKGLIWAEGESHRRQRRSIAPSFNSTAIRKLSPAIHKVVDRLKAALEESIDANGGESVVLDVEKWVNYVSLDSFGIAGFSYDFDSLAGKPNSMISVLDDFAAPSPHPLLDNAVFLLSIVFPIAMYVPTWRNKMLDKLRGRMSEICDKLVDNAIKEKEGASNEQTSTIGLLLNAEDEDSGKRIVREEVLAQISTLIFASYETTAIAMTWALLELARYPDIQNKLRKELLSFGREPSYDELTTGLPYLDAIVQETLRLHPAVQDLVREANEDDVIPLSEPVRTKSGEVVDSIAIERGTEIGISISCMNRSEAIWGPDAKVFRPERWLEADGITKKAQEVKGYRHLLTFGDGPRSCIGKMFAVAEIKTMLTMLVKNFVLEMRDGPDTKFEIIRGIALRPKIAGEDGIKMPLRVRPYKG
ncbi:cytochrome P450 [Pisolithus orientalis]|uniref:cytochrome P450 n=1 Tax=Pisolithus orientalis TaxID=936130 RepID=UPI0022256F50|nr:cytochrome P450 [Pisolithus orientalis]KAI6004500.1 cytochrome P450 [Pisolithus orientalis]